MLGKGKGALLVALLGKKPEAEAEEKDETSSDEVDGGEYDEALESSAEDLLSAIAAKDAGAVAKAFGLMHQVCAEGAED